MAEAINYGPLKGLLGTWKGDCGLDIAPEPDGEEENSYYETLTFEAIGDVDNAEEQELAVVSYEQVVRKKVNDEILHHQVGYWTWDANAQTVCNSFSIPRRVTVLAGGTVEQNNEETTLSVVAEKGNSEWGILESAFMSKNASTSAFEQTLIVRGNSLNYQQTIWVDIYGKKRFQHTDKNTLVKV